MHIIAQATYEDPRSVYHDVGPQFGSQEKAGDIYEVREQCQTLERRLKSIEGNDVFGAATM